MLDRVEWAPGGEDNMWAIDYLIDCLHAIKVSAADGTSLDMNKKG